MAEGLQCDLAPVHASVSDAPSARQRGAWLQPGQSVSGSKCVRRTGHGFNGKTATVEVRKRVATENHQVRVALVDPERDLHSAVRISELHTSEAILIALKVGERMVREVPGTAAGLRINLSGSFAQDFLRTS